VCKPRRVGRPRQPPCRPLRHPKHPTQPAASWVCRRRAPLPLLAMAVGSPTSVCPAECHIAPCAAYPGSKQPKARTHLAIEGVDPLVLAHHDNALHNPGTKSKRSKFGRCLSPLPFRHFPFATSLSPLPFRHFPFATSCPFPPSLGVPSSFSPGGSTPRPILPFEADHHCRQLQHNVGKLSAACQPHGSRGALLTRQHKRVGRYPRIM
jgi:hypothetical protein